MGSVSPETGDIIIQNRRGFGQPTMPKMSEENSWRVVPFRCGEMFQITLHVSALGRKKLPPKTS